ncbi:HPr-rel-A system PqqD family peptide chaperone [Conexibacter sp. S30A1]|uniref:HPr-rel-A system PqqD family peptide chaperone n=1 Tax=Conexibacter sp. S30A1 TaxID=2937800 RepID=UPI002010447A|nr:HPr-rel-A system PqqD family peptide chaperone [Conexibacter sp. S30A1]
MSRGTDDNFAKARADGLVTERVGDELVVYDSRTSEAHCLHPLAAAVFAAADGRRSPAAIAAQVSAELGDRFEVQHIDMALAELEDRGLVTVPVSGGISRRSFVQRSAAIGGVAFAGTLITSVVAPAYGQAASATGLPGGFSSMVILVSDDCGGTNATYYTANWGNNTSNGGQGSVNGQTFANANCALVSPPTVTSGWGPDNNTVPNLYFVSNTQVCIALNLPSSYTICEWAAWFGNADAICGKGYQGGVCITSTELTPAVSPGNCGSNSYFIDFSSGTCN